MRLCISWVFATVTTLVISAEGFPSFPAYKSHSILSSDKDQHLSSSSSALVPSLARAGGTSASSREKGDSYFDDEDNPKAETPSETQRDLFDSLLRLRFARDQAEGEDKENDGKDGGRNKDKERRRLATMTENFIDGNLGSAVRKRGQSLKGLSLEVPDAYSLRKEDRPPNSLVVFKKNADGPTLSIYSPLDVLRQRMLLDMARRRMQQSEHQIKANEEILKDLGKRSASYWQSAWSSTGDDKQPFRQRNSRGNVSIGSEGYV